MNIYKHKPIGATSMKTYLQGAVFFAVGLCCALPIHAQQERLQATLKNCASCHGARGVAPNSSWPNLAGQKHEYLVRQMLAFRDGARKDALMSPPMQGLSDALIDQLADHYAKLPVAKGTSVANVNHAGKNVRAYCVACHGMYGETVNPTWPNLAGQQKEYTYQQLQKYRSGERVHPLMQVIARELSEEQMLQVAEFYSQQER